MRTPEKVSVKMAAPPNPQNAPPQNPVPAPPQQVVPTQGERRWESIKFNFVSAGAVMLLVIVLMLFLELMLWLRSTPKESCEVPEMYKKMYELMLAERQKLMMFGLQKNDTAVTAA